MATYQNPAVSYLAAWYVTYEYSMRPLQNQDVLRQHEPVSVPPTAIVGYTPTKQSDVSAPMMPVVVVLA